MNINLKNSIFTPKEKEIILEKLIKASDQGYIEQRHENNSSLLASYKGISEEYVTPKWNVKIYNYNRKKQGHSLVCTDKEVLGRLLAEDYNSFIPPDLPVLSIDDAGWGFPLCGVMTGVSDGETIRTAVVPVEYFRNNRQNHFQNKRYLKVYADLAIGLLGEFGASPKTHRIEICTGIINQLLAERLRHLGYHVRRIEITGILQDQLEEAYRTYVLEEIGSDIYYDPKAIKKGQIPQNYKRCLAYGEKCCPEKIKAGWGSLAGRDVRKTN